MFISPEVAATVHPSLHDRRRPIPKYQRNAPRAEWTRLARPEARSVERGRPRGADRLVTALGIILTAVLVLVNAFFVIAEYALVRSRRARLEAMADEGARGARLRAHPVRQHRRLHLGLPGRDHDGLDRHRRARRARDHQAAQGRVRRLRSPTALAVVISVVIAYLLITAAQIVIGEIVPKLYAIQHAEGAGPADRPSARVLAPAVHARSSSC